MKIRGLRWWIAGLLFLASVLNYVDRNTLSLLAKTIQDSLTVSDQQYADIQVAFQVAYAIALLLSGLIVDKIGPRWALALFLGWWSLASLATSLTTSAFTLGAAMFMMGLGEAGNWTAAPKAVAAWFPPRERGLAIGLYTAGTPIGMTIAPLFIIALNAAWGWRATFVATALLGFVWLAPWLWFYRRKLLTEAESTTIAAGVAPANAATPTVPGWTYGEAFRRREVWCLLLGRMFSDPVWFFYLIWFPKYLQTARGLTQSDVKITWIVFLAAGIGSTLGGWLASVFIKRGWAPPRARLLILLGCAIVMPLSPLVAYAPTVAVVIGVAAVICFAHLAWLTNITALCVDVIPGPSLGKVFGLVAAGSSIGAIVMNKLVGALLMPDPVTKLVAPGAYTQWFLIAACLHLLVLPVIAWGVWRHKASEA
ncbi:MAG: MFS transporter [Kiritimatiellaeota bacterium]|nr:MFS transporter [Kiritimatiellota bacterium]